MKTPVTAESLIADLHLEKHVEGGYYRRTFQSDHRDKIATSRGDRFTLTSIYYLLTASSPIGHWHFNQSDIIHFYHAGSPIKYYVIDPSGQLSTFTLGPDLSAGHHFQYVVRGGNWKASYLEVDLSESGNFGLISEAVSPGFDFQDMMLGDRHKLLELYPQHKDIVEKFLKVL